MAKSIIHKSLLTFLTAGLSLGIMGCTPSNSDDSPQQAVVVDEQKSLAVDVAEQLQSEVIKHNLYHYPELTLLLAVNDVQATSEKIKSVGGKIVYDPNLEQGQSVPFLVATIPAEKVVDQDFIRGLNLKAANIDHPSIRAIRPQSTGPVSDDPVFVPVKDIKLEAFRQSQNGKGLGENTLVAVIDTGVDAAHPIFQERVVYWQDQTQETKLLLKEMDVVEGQIQVGNNSLTLPEAISGNEKVMYAVIDEARFRAQLGDGDKNQGAEGLDLNRNGNMTDKFSVVVGQGLDHTIAFVDTDNQDGLANEKPILDFNEARSLPENEVSNGLIQFPNRQRKVAYPLLMEKNSEGQLVALHVGVDFNNHGTHVAGIMAGNGEQIQGASPKSQIMAQKVCSGITCTTAAILRALVDTFYNDQGLVPDVVNISLGSHETYTQDVFNYLMRDLASKFGATFFISASNSGTGYRSINSIGSFGPVISVGAHVSKNTLQKLYTLDPGIEIPDHNLLFFSSVGPSYTGQLRPNLVAPGSALSSTSMINEASAMFNGTSMSSPLAAGAAAALISALKHNDVYSQYKAMKQAKIQDIQAGGVGVSSGTLMPFPLAVRTSLEETAIEMAQYTKAQQGHGLIDIPAAYEHMLTLLDMVNSDQVLHFDFAINNSQKANRLYDRDVNIAGVKTITLAVEADGEMTDLRRLKIQNTTYKVILDRVEVQQANGDVITLKEDPPFAIAQSQGTGELRTHGEIVLSNRYKSRFNSVRDLDRMEAGKTYVAVYNVLHEERRIFTLLDVVHKPIELPNRLQNLYLPGISTDHINKAAAFGVAGVDISANAFHRYPVALSEKEHKLLLDVALSPNVNGNIYVQVYDPDGAEVYFGVLNGDSQSPRQRRKVSTELEIFSKPGIYEVTLSTGNRSWMGPTQYDILLRATRFMPNKDKVVLNSGGHGHVIFTDYSGQITSVNAKLSKLTRLQMIKGVKVVPSHWTYVKVDLPEDLQKTTDWVVAIAADEKVGKGFFGRIDHNLYEKRAEGEYEAVASAVVRGAAGDKKTFSAVDGTKELYVALETFDVVPELGGLNDSVDKLDLELTFPKEVVSADVELKLHTENSQNGVFDYIINVNSVDLPASETPKALLKGSVEVTTNDSRTKLSLPFTIKH